MAQQVARLAWTKDTKSAIAAIAVAGLGISVAGSLVLSRLVDAAAGIVDAESRFTTSLLLVDPACTESRGEPPAALALVDAPVEMAVGSGSSALVWSTS